MLTKKILGFAVVAALAFATPVPTHADTYAPQADSQNFTGSAGGWSASTSYDGLCLPALLCPTVTNSWSSGGYIRTQFLSVAETLLGTSVGVWQSPAFTYKGKKGHEPATMRLDLNMRSDLAALLGVDLLNDASYRVDLVAPGGHLINVVPTTGLVDNTTWSAIPSASVNPKLLKIGRSYRIRITTTYHSVASVIATGEVGYDNVRLTTAGRSGSGITTVKELRETTTTVILPGSTKMVRNHVKLLLRCPGKAAPKKCRINVHGLAGGKASKQATTKKFIKLRAGTQRWVKVRVKPKYLAKYRNSRKVWIKSVVHVGKTRVVVRKHVKLKH